VVIVVMGRLLLLQLLLLLWSCDYIAQFYKRWLVHHEFVEFFASRAAARVLLLDTTLFCLFFYNIILFYL